MSKCYGAALNSSPNIYLYAGAIFRLKQLIVLFTKCMLWKQVKLCKITRDILVVTAIFFFFPCSLAISGQLIPEYQVSRMSHIPIVIQAGAGNLWSY